MQTVGLIQIQWVKFTQRLCSSALGLIASSHIKMESNFAIDGRNNYVRSLEVHRRKSGNLINNNELLNQHLTPLVEDIVKKNKPTKQFNILSVGSGTGKTDFEIIKIVREVLSKSGHPQVKIFNRAVEPGAASLQLFRENIIEYSKDDLVEFDLVQKTFDEYKEGKAADGVQFDLIHFVHSTSYLDVEKTFSLCFEEELKSHGIITVIVVGKDDLLYKCCLKQGHVWHGGHSNTECWLTGDEMIAIAAQHNWKHQIFSQEYSLDVTDVFDDHSEDGNLLLDFITFVQDFRKTQDAQQVKEMLDCIKNHCTPTQNMPKDGKRYGKRTDQLLFLYRP